MLRHTRIMTLTYIWWDNQFALRASTQSRPLPYLYHSIKYLLATTCNYCWHNPVLMCRLSMCMINIEFSCTDCHTGITVMVMHGAATGQIYGDEIGPHRSTSMSIDYVMNTFDIHYASWIVIKYSDAHNSHFGWTADMESQGSNINWKSPLTRALPFFVEVILLSLKTIKFWWRTRTFKTTWCYSPLQTDHQHRLWIISKGWMDVWNEFHL